MKSPRVDIFRPLAAATRGCRPSASATSIFRRNHNHHHHSNNNNSNSNSHGNSNNSQTQQQQQQQQRTGNPQTSTSEEDEEESFVVSVPPGAWPPHRNAFGSGSSAADGSSAQHEALDIAIAAPLPTATSSGDDRGSGGDNGVGDDSWRSRRGSSASRGESKSPSKRGKGKQQQQLQQQLQPISRPSYYKIELAEGSGGACRLTSGDDSSVVLTADHNELLQLADDGIRPSPRGIIRASPIVEQQQQQQQQHNQQQQQLLQLESIEHKVEGGPEHSITYSPSKKRQSTRQRWTISDNGTIIAVPPSPSSVSASRFRQTSSAAVAKPSKHPEEGDDNGHDDNDNHDNFSIPPLLAKASNGSSDDSFVSVDSSSEEDNQTFEKGVAARNSEGSSQLESPPRMNRSAIGHSLFQESLSSKESSDEEHRRNNDPIKGCMSNRSKSSKSTDRFVSGGAGCCAAAYGRSGGRGRSRSPDDKRQGRGGGCGARGPLLFGEFFGQILDVFSLNGGCCHQQQQQQSQSQRNSSSGNAGAAY